jgi:RNA polymerase sigma-70 factor (ECF subfamily)
MILRPPTTPATYLSNRRYKEIGNELMLGVGASAVAKPERGAEAVSASFTEVLRSNQAMVFSIAYHFLRDRHSAEEVAQDVFLQLYRNMSELRSEAHVTFWLRRVTSNRCIDFVRKRKRQATTALEDAPEPSMTNDPGDLLLNRRLRALLGSLPETPRMVMVLRYQEDLMPEEIARLLEMPVRTVKSHLQRSLAMLREKIGRSMGDVR